MRYTAHIYKDGEQFSVEFPDFNNIFTWASTLEQAKQEAKEALELAVEASLEEGEPLPYPKTKANVENDLYPISIEFVEEQDLFIVSSKMLEKAFSHV